MALALALLAQSMGDLVEQWKDRDIEVRNRATEQVLAGWKTWSERDLETLRRLSSAADSEIAARAKGALARIEVRRTVSPNVLEKLPGTEDALCTGAERDRLKLLSDAARLWRRAELTDGDLKTLTKLPWSLDTPALLDTVRWWGEEGGAFAVAPLAPLVAPLLKHGDARVRAEAAATLGLARAGDHAAELLPLLGDGDVSVRAEAAAAIGLMGAVEHAPRIIPLLKDPKSEVRQSTAEALGRLGTGDAELVLLLDDGDTNVRAHVVRALGRIGAARHAGAIAALIKTDQPAVRGIAASVLAQLDAREHAGTIAWLLKDPEEWVRRSAVTALGVLGARAHAGAVAALLAERYWATRLAAVRALGRMGAAEHAGAIAPLLKDEELRVRWETAAALARLDARDQIARIVPALKDADVWHRKSAADALGRLRAKEHAADVAPLLKDADWSMRHDAARALRRMDAPVGDALLKDANAFCREEAARALGQLSRWEGLERLERDPDPGVRGAAAIALLRLGRKDVAQQARLLRESLSEELLDALAHVHERAAHEKLHREIRLAQAVETPQALAGLLKEAGLALEGAEKTRLVGRLRQGATMSAGLALECLFEGDDDAERARLVAVPEGDVLRLMTRQDARRHWERRLK